MPTPPLFTVIVPVYNVALYLPACVKSIVEQPGPCDWECILVDDGSTDACGKMCDVFAAECPAVRVLHQPNAGLAGARNTGIAAARGAWLLFLDSDDTWPADLLPNLRAALAEHPGYAWYVGRYLQLDEPTGELVPPAYAFVPGPCQGLAYPARVERLYASAGWSVWKYCVSRALLERTGVRFCAAVRWAEDWPFDLELLHACDRLYFLDFPFSVYRANRAGSLMNRGLPGRFAAILAALDHLQGRFAPDAYTAADRQEVFRRAGDVFWPQARAAAVRDPAVRRACEPGIARCRPLYDCGAQARRGPAQTFYRFALKYFGARFALWAAGLRRRHP